MENSIEVVRHTKDILKCPYCLIKIKSVPIFQCINGHVTCKNCIPKCTGCPVCKNEEIPVRNLKLEKIVKKMEGYQMEDLTLSSKMKLKWKKKIIQDISSDNLWTSGLQRSTDNSTGIFQNQYSYNNINTIQSR